MVTCRMGGMARLREGSLCGLVALMLLALCGCGGAASGDAAGQTSHLRTLVALYAYATSQLRHEPKSEAEFKEFIAQSGGPVLQRLELTSPDALFVSERDGQPFAVVYAPRPAGVDREVVAYEQTGVDGRRLVGFKLGEIKELDAAGLAQYVK